MGWNDHIDDPMPDKPTCDICGKPRNDGTFHYSEEIYRTCYESVSKSDRTIYKNLWLCRACHTVMATYRNLVESERIPLREAERKENEQKKDTWGCEHSTASGFRL